MSKGLRLTLVIVLCVSMFPVGAAAAQSAHTPLGPCPRSNTVASAAVVRSLNLLKTLSLQDTSLKMLLPAKPLRLATFRLTTASRTKSLVI